MNSQFKPDTWAGKIYSLGQKVFENSSNKEIAALVNCDNHGIVSRERKTVSDKTGWTMPVGRQSAQETNTAQPIQSAKPRKAGSLPEKIQGYLVSAVDEIPETWKPENVFPVIDEDSVAWNRFIRRLHDIDSAMIESFEKWLGRAATLNRQCAFDAVVEEAEQWERKLKAEYLARALLELGFDKTPTAILRELWV
jgi:hypothetical protein